MPPLKERDYIFFSWSVQGRKDSSSIASLFWPSPVLSRDRVPGTWQYSLVQQRYYHQLCFPTAWATGQSHSASLHPTEATFLKLKRTLSTFWWLNTKFPPIKKEKKRNTHSNHPLHQLPGLSFLPFPAWLLERVVAVIPSHAPHTVSLLASTFGTLMLG